MADRYFDELRALSKSGDAPVFTPSTMLKAIKLKIAYRARAERAETDLAAALARAEAAEAATQEQLHRAQDAEAHFMALEEALRPFAEACDLYRWPGHDDGATIFSDTGVTFKLGELRRAARALAGDPS